MIKFISLNKYILNTIEQFTEQIKSSLKGLKFKVFIVETNDIKDYKNWWLQHKKLCKNFWKKYSKRSENFVESFSVFSNTHDVKVRDGWWQTHH